MNIKYIYIFLIVYYRILFAVLPIIRVEHSTINEEPSFNSLIILLLTKRRSFARISKCFGCSKKEKKLV